MRTSCRPGFSVTPFAHKSLPLECNTVRSLGIPSKAKHSPVSCSFKLPGCEANAGHRHPLIRQLLSLTVEQAHLSKVEVAVLEVVAEQRGALIDSNVVPNVDQVKV